MVKVRYIPFILLLAIHIAFLFPLFHDGVYKSHDGEAQIARFAAYSKAFVDKHIPPRWAGDLNFRYGSPVFNFYYPLPGYTASLLRITNVSFQDIYKILMGLAFIAAPVGMYLWLKIRLNKKSAFVGALLYGLSPYHFLDIYVRGDIGEMMALVFLPLVFLAIDRSHILAGGIAYGLLILSHNGISLMFTPVLLIYSLFFTNNNSYRRNNFCLFIIGLSLSAFFWIPALFELQYTQSEIFIGKMYKDHFPTIQQLIYSPWGSGPNVRKAGGLSPQIGPLLIVLTLGGFIIFLIRKRKSPFLLFWLSIFAAGVFFSLQVSTPFWSYSSLLQKFQFPWRFNVLSTFSAVVISSVMLNSVKIRWLNITVAFTAIVLAIPIMNVNTYINNTDSYYLSYPATTNYHGETTTIWSAGDPGSHPLQPFDIIGGQGTISNIKRSTINHTFTVSAKSNVQILDNTFYYPGWHVYVNDVTVPIQFQDQNHRGLITFTVPKGTHRVKILFNETPLRIISNVISIVTLLSLVLLWFLRYKRGAFYQVT